MLFLREYINLLYMKNDTPPPSLVGLKLNLCEYPFIEKQSTLWGFNHVSVSPIFHPGGA